LPRARGLVEVADGKTRVRSSGRWVLGVLWRPRTATPPSPGWVSGDSTFAYAAARVLSALTGRSFAARAEQVSRAAVADGTELAIDASAGRTLGLRVARLVLRKLAP
jgi:hypothetical protein